MNKESKIYLVCGSGGVGKTTVSAALGLKFATEGFKTIVLTIDPAKRLATSLGIENLSDDPQKIILDKKCKGEMWAMMLDTKRTFDRIVEKYATSQETRERIFKNKIYQHMSQMLAGTQEYMAMERLYEIHQQKTYDIIVVDTPPMQNALDFLAAPQKMHNMISNSMLHLLLKPTLSLGKSGFKFLEKGSQNILKVFDRITGFAFMQEISELLIAFKDLLSGFETRSAAVSELLASEYALFLIVCTTQTNSIEESLSFQKQLDSNHYKLDKVIVNRVYSGEVFTKEKLEEIEKSLIKTCGSDVSQTLVKNYNRFRPLIKRDQAQLRELTKIIGKNHTACIPLFLSDVHHQDGLLQVAKSIDVVD